MLYMVIENFEDSNLALVEDRFQSKGRLMPDGLVYVTSWMTNDGSQCYQIMESPSRELLDAWIQNWSDLVDFQVKTIVASAEFWSRRNLGP
jgi:hypothetical protein